ncbi:hypothetical protein [Fibrobacter sp. UWR3]|uniref:hypothetical protein n=1 Tax=Fibrobacter sp. UWR3 TaxID=1896217 RepID=UPI0015B50D7E|nr:hypothetical protein [Fibrobacter sp. UWR3]
MQPIRELDEDSTELLLDLVLLLDPSTGSGTFEELLDFGVTLDEDPSSQSSHTLDDDPSEGRVAKLLSSSPQATKKSAKKSANTRCMDPRRSLS